MVTMLVLNTRLYRCISGYHYDGQGESQQFGAPQNDYASAFAAASAQQMRPMGGGGGGGGFGDYSGYGPPSGNSGAYTSLHRLETVSLAPRSRFSYSY